MPESIEYLHLSSAVLTEVGSQFYFVPDLVLHHGLLLFRVVPTFVGIKPYTIRVPRFSRALMTDNVVNIVFNYFY
jgi:hypothetical protein